MQRLGYCKRNFTDVFDYEEYDVCYNQTYLTRLAVEFKLNSSYMKTDLDDENFLPKNAITLIVTYINQALMNILSEIVLNRYKYRENSAITIFRDEITFPKEYGYHQHKIAAYKTTTSLRRCFVWYGWKNAALILLKSKGVSVFHVEQYESILYDIQKLKNICFINQTVHTEQQFQDVAFQLRKQEFRTPKILFGPPDEQMRFIKAVESEWVVFYNHQWVLHDVEWEHFNTLNQPHWQTGTFLFINRQLHLEASESCEKFEREFCLFTVYWLFHRK